MSKTGMCSLAVVATMAMATATASADAQGQPGEGACTVDISTAGCPGLGNHKAPGGTGYEGEPHATTCEPCKHVTQQGDTVSVPIENCHPVCDSGFLEEDDAVREAYYALRAAAARGEVDRVLLWASRARNYVTINAERHAVQIASCAGAGTIVASFRLHPTLLASLEAALASPPSTVPGPEAQAWRPPVDDAADGQSTRLPQ